MFERVPMLHAGAMESLLSINGIAQALGWIGVPILAAAALLTVVVLSGGAERIIDLVENLQVARSASQNRHIEREEPNKC